MEKEHFFAKMEELGIALTYDDVRLRTGHSEVMPSKVNLRTKFSRNIPLNIPLVSAAMDTVTEYKMAIGMAKLGGIGVIHKNLSSQEQAFHVAKVKNHLNGLVGRPITVLETDTVETVLRKKEEKSYNFHTFPVIDAAGKLVGIFSRKDLYFCDDHNVLVREVMSTELVTGKKEVTLEEAYEIMKENKKKTLPLITADGEIAGMYVWSDVQRIITGSHSNYNIDENGQLRVAAAIGVGEDASLRLEKLIQEKVDAVVIDTAHADSKPVMETLKEIKRTREYDCLDVVVGNISEPKSAERLVLAGADGIKVGQGPGSICTTRIIAGIGCPQVTAVYECSQVAGKYDIPICADGGLKYSGDIPIALGAGAHSVMMGSMLAGTDESPGEIIFLGGRQWKGYRGMGSLAAMEKNQGSRERYQQSSAEKNKLVPEGVEGLAHYKGELKEVVHQYLGGLRAGMGYVELLILKN